MILIIEIQVIIKDLSTRNSKSGYGFLMLGLCERQFQQIWRVKVLQNLNYRVGIIPKRLAGFTLSFWNF